MSNGAGHRVTIDFIECGECGRLMEPAEDDSTWRCQNMDCENSLKEWRPRILMDEVVKPHKTIPGVEV